MIPPDLIDGAAFYFEAFQELSSDRMSGLALGPIRFGALDAYARRHGAFGLNDPDGFELFRQAIRALDAVYLDHHAKAD